jgi:hypothetical protein
MMRAGKSARLFEVNRPSVHAALSICLKVSVHFEKSKELLIPKFAPETFSVSCIQQVPFTINCGIV